MFYLVRLAFLYLVFGAGILFVQLNNTPCKAPVVLDDGGPPLGPPVDLARLGTDRDYAMRLGKHVVFWLPRLIDLVGIRGMPFPDYLFATACMPERDGAAPPAGHGAAPPAAPAVPPAPPVRPRS